MNDQAQKAMTKAMMEEQFSKGFRSVYRPEKHKPGEKVNFMGHDRGYEVQADGSLKRVFPKVKGKKARKADKRERHAQRRIHRGSETNGTV